MLCTNCSEPIRPVVALDIDGTLGDYHGHFLNFAMQYLGWNEVSVLRYDGTRGFGEWCCEIFGIDMTTFRLVKLAYRQGGLKRSMPIDPEAPALFEMLHLHEVEIWLCTTRPYLRLDGVDPDTRFWLDRHGLHYHGLLYDEDKYDQLAERVAPERVIAVLDDLPEQVEAARRLFGGAAMFLANDYNYGVRPPIIIDGLDTARQMIQHRLLKWRSDHATRTD